MNGRLSRNWTCLVLLSGVLVSSGASAEETLRLVRPPRGTKISQLRWSKKPPTLEEEPTGVGKDTRSVVDLVGLYPRKDWNLVYKSTRIKPNARGVFRLKVPMSSRLARVDLVAIGPLGEVEKETLGILFPNYAEYRKNLSAGTNRRHFFTPGLGFSSISYAQPTKGIACNQIMATGKLSYVYLLSQKWDLGISGFASLAPVSGACSVPSSGDAGAALTNGSLRFIGLNFRAGYSLPAVKEPWRLSLMAGTYFLTMTVSPATFGFQNVAGPQLFPVLRRSLSSGDSIVGYFKFSPVSSGFSVLQIANREIAAGGAYLFKLKNGHSLSATLDIANLALELADTSGVLQKITNTSISLGVGYSL